MSSETQPRPTADRIAKLEREIAAWHRNIGRVSTQEERDEFLRLTAELARLRNEQPRDKTDEWDREHAKSRVIVQDENGRFKAIDKHTPSPAPSPEPQDVRGAESSAWAAFWISVEARGHKYEDMQVGFHAGWQAALAQSDAPGHSDLMVRPETLDAFMEANPLPSGEAAQDARVTDAMVDAAWRVIHKDKACDCRECIRAALSAALAQSDAQNAQLKDIIHQMNCDLMDAQSDAQRREPCGCYLKPGDICPACGAERQSDAQPDLREAINAALPCIAPGDGYTILARAIGADDLIGSMPTPPDASGLIEAAEWHEEQAEINEMTEAEAEACGAPDKVQKHHRDVATFHKESAKLLRTRAADRSAPRTEDKE